ncbi:hypothetical protein DM02DRAFT_546905, partial [Periconia macrospinosa]
SAGLFPFNPDRLLRAMPEPLAQLNVPRANEVSSTSDNVLQTPTTPVSPKALTSLHHLINQDASALNEQSQQRLRKHVQKLANAAQISFAKCTLLQDQNQFLYKINSEANVRRSTRKVVLGKAKVMSFEDLEDARTNRRDENFHRCADRTTTASPTASAWAMRSSI